MAICKIIEEKLKRAFDVQHLEVINESHLHQGHAGDDGSGESHFSIIIASDDFSNISTLGCHRRIYAALEDEIKVIHALSIKIKKN